MTLIIIQAFNTMYLQDRLIINRHFGGTGIILLETFTFLHVSITIDTNVETFSEVKDSGRR